MWLGDRTAPAAGQLAAHASLSAPRGSPAALLRARLGTLRTSGSPKMPDCCGLHISRGVTHRKTTSRQVKLASPCQDARQVNVSEMLMNTVQQRAEEVGFAMHLCPLKLPQR